MRAFRTPDAYVDALDSVTETGRKEPYQLLEPKS
jgi:hypothetical protein